MAWEDVREAERAGERVALVGRQGTRCGVLVSDVQGTYWLRSDGGALCALLRVQNGPARLQRENGEVLLDGLGDPGGQ